MSREFPRLEDVVPDVPAGSERLRVCLLTPDIFGPTRNGGIGTACFHLAKLLARSGHDVTVLYTRPDLCESGRVADWVEFYRRLGIQFIPLAEPRVKSGPGFFGAVTVTARRVYEALAEMAPFDLVHCPEWRGDAYYALLAKRLGLDFRQTIFCVTAHSPHLWNLEGNLEHVESKRSLATMHMERSCIELADVVLSPTRCMLEWLAAHDFRLPPGHTYVQPNAFEVPESAADPRDAPRARPVSELVFFGRLDRCKGIHVFLDCLDLLRESGALGGRSVTVLGKESATWQARDIAQRAAAWGVPISIQTNWNSEEALAYLRQPGRLAVIPSLSDNAPYTVIECLTLGIPFLASDRGGIPELVAEADRGRVLFTPRPQDLADKLRGVLDVGATPARCAFDHKQAGETWRRFHGALAARSPGLFPPPLSAPALPARGETPLVSVCIPHYERPAKLQQVLRALERQTLQDFEVVVADDGSRSPAAVQFLDRLEEEFRARGWRLHRQENSGPDAARNAAASLARGRYLLFMDDDNLPKPEELEVFTKTAEFSGADALTCFADAFDSDEPREQDGALYRIALLGGAISLGLLENCFGDTNSLIRAAAFREAGGFTVDRGAGREDHELFARLALRGYRLMVVPRALYWYRMDPGRRSIANRENAAGPLRVLRTYLAHTPPELHDAMRYALGCNEQEKRLGDVAPILDSYTWRIADGLRRAIIRLPGLERLLILARRKFR